MILLKKERETWKERKTDRKKLCNKFNNFLFIFLAGIARRTHCVIARRGKVLRKIGGQRPDFTDERKYFRRKSKHPIVKLNF